jgi:hypothetical protein
MSRCARAVERDRLLVESLDDERLVYDTAAGRAHSMSAQAWEVLLSLDGKTSTAALARRFATSPKSIDETIAALASAGLLVSTGARRIDRGRRRALVALAGAAPIVFSIVAPSVAEAASGFIKCDNPCIKAGDCCGNSGSAARTCDVQLKCNNMGGGNPACKGATCL